MDYLTSDEEITGTNFDSTTTQSTTSSITEPEVISSEPTTETITIVHTTTEVLLTSDEQPMVTSTEPLMFDETTFRTTAEETTTTEFVRTIPINDVSFLPTESDADMETEKTSSIDTKPISTSTQAEVKYFESTIQQFSSLVDLSTNLSSIG